MVLSRLRDRFYGLIGRPLRSAHSPERRLRGPRSHVIILDGTLSSLEYGYETNAGVAYRLCAQMGADVSVYYESGVQWRSWRSLVDVSMGRGINRQIRRAYGYLASRYRPGDRVFFLGYSRGAFAVRSLAGVIDMVGLLKAEHATERNIRTAYRHYELTPESEAARVFARKFCHDVLPIEMVGVWDTVKALGLRLPYLWQMTEVQHGFHNHHLGRSVRNGFHALALDETREVYAPVMWECPEAWPGRVEQVWFRGGHADIGGQLDGFEAARPLSNIPLVWMLERAEECGLPLPDGWRTRFYTDVNAPAVGTWRSWGKVFLLRRPRVVGRDRSERLHESVAQSADRKMAARFHPSSTLG
ncbi:MAG: DUF2235 domain-containing protein [Pseudooceanicola sp.]|nr:DUF2235 domain-containing protein [Pseudooceanicola sp.]